MDREIGQRSEARKEEEGYKKRRREVLNGGRRVQRGENEARKTFYIRGKGLEMGESDGWGIHYDRREGVLRTEGTKEEQEVRKDITRYCNKFRGGQDDGREKVLDKATISAGGNIEVGEVGVMRGKE